MFIWRGATAATPGHWERKGVNEQCVSISQVSVNTQTGKTYNQVIAASKFLTWQRGQEKQVADAAFAASLPPCPTSSYSQLSTAGGMPGGVACYDKGAGYADASLPPGTFLIFGVPFNAAELTDPANNGEFKRTFVPNGDQRTWIEAAIVAQSVAQLGAWMKVNASAIALVPPSVSALLKDPEWTVSLGPNFYSNPIPPTNDEMNGRGGLQHWLDRGGFPLNLHVARGEVQIGDALAPPAVCVSISCGCPDPIYGLRPRCIGAWVTTKGLVVRGRIEPGDWHQFVAMDDQHFYVKFAYKDPSWIVQTGEWLAKQINDLFSTLCGNQGAVDQQIAAQNAVQCIDANKKPCKQGTAGCTCAAVPPYANASAQLFSSYLSAVCGVIDTQNNQGIPPIYPPVLPPTIPVEQPLTMMQFGLVVAAGLGIGALAFGNR